LLHGARIFAKGHVQMPMQAIFHAPVTPRRRGQFGRVEGTGTDGVTLFGLAQRLVLEASSLHPSQGSASGPLKRIDPTVVLGHPALVKHEPAMLCIHRRRVLADRLERLGMGRRKGASPCPVERGRITLDGQEIVGPILFDEGAGDLLLATHGIHG